MNRKMSKFSFRQFSLHFHSSLAHFKPKTMSLQKQFDAQNSPLVSGCFVFKRFIPVALNIKLNT